MFWCWLSGTTGQAVGFISVVIWAIFESEFCDLSDRSRSVDEQSLEKINVNEALLLFMILSSTFKWQNVPGFWKLHYSLIFKSISQYLNQSTFNSKPLLEEKVSANNPSNESCSILHTFFLTNSKDFIETNSQFLTEFQGHFCTTMLERSYQF